MKKTNVTFKARLSGILLGASAALLTFVLAGTMVYKNGDFWLNQEEKNKYTERLMLYSSDDYSKLYHTYQNLLSGKTAPDKPVTVTYHNDPEKHTATYIDAEKLECGDTVFYQYESTVEISEKYIASLKEYTDAVKKPFTYEQGFRIELNVVPEKKLKDKTNVHVELMNIFLSDENGNRLNWQLVYSYFDDNGRIRNESVDNAHSVPFETNLDIKLVLKDNQPFNKVNISFSIQSEIEKYTVNPRLTYREDLDNVEVAKKIGYEAEITTFDERNEIKRVGDLSDYAVLFSGLLLMASIVFAVYTVIKEKRISLFGIGLNMILSALFVGIIIGALVSISGISIFTFNEGTVSSMIMGRGFMKDLSMGIARFYAFLMLIPVVIGYFIMKLSVSKKEDPNEDYMYQ